MKIQYRNGLTTTTEELKEDIAAAQDLGFNFEHQFAFTCATVDALIAKIDELEQTIKKFKS